MEGTVLQIPGQNPRLIVIHHSLTRDGATVSWGAIRRYHVDELGWSDIGYHAGVELVGDRYEVLMGRDWYQVGAHTHGQNEDSLGLCIVGNWDEEAPPEAQLVSGAAVVRLWMRLFDIGPLSVYPHSHFNAAKSCPGKLFPWTDFMELVND